MPDKTVVKNHEVIDRILKEELGYREGVYNEVVFASQKRAQNAIVSIMEEHDKKNKDLTETIDNLKSTLTRAALETGGVSIDMLGRKLQEILDKYCGHWNIEADAPEGGKKRGITNKWIRGAGTILEAYYDMEEIRQEQKNAEDAEKEVEAFNEDIKRVKEKRQNVNAEKTDFQKYYTLISNKATLSTISTRLNKEIKDMQEASDNWPELERMFKEAQNCAEARNNADIHEKYLKVLAAKNGYARASEEKSSLLAVSTDDVDRVSMLLKSKQRDESKLAGLDLTAKIRKLGDLPIEVRTVSSGLPLELQDGECRISEAVIFSVPGVMEIQLIPTGINVDDLKDNIRNAENTINSIFEKYSVTNLLDLQNAKNDYDTAKMNFEQAEIDLKNALGDETWEMIEEEFNNISRAIIPPAEVEEQIQELCGEKTLDAYIGGVEATLECYQNKYHSIEELRIELDNLLEERNKQQEKLDKLEDIPEKYCYIDDPDSYYRNLEEKITMFDGEIERLNNYRSEAFRKLGDRTAQDYSEELEEKENTFKAIKEEFTHWKNIYDVFCQMKEQVKENPAEDIEKRFKEYLGVLSVGNLQLQSLDENMNTKLMSGNNKLTYAILSNGTKDTISLAFRLAMLEHLYPEGNGLAIFDDPFTDMDPERVSQACRLIEKFAENNQVIFITCDDKYRNLISANNVIEMSA